MRVPLNDSKRQYLALKEDIDAAVSRVLASGRYVHGEEHAAFEAELADYCGARHAIGVASGTDALELALRTLGCGAGDQVATVANAGMYSTTAILAAGGAPLYVEVDPSSMTMDPEDLAQRLASAVRAVIVTHLYGRMADMPRLVQVAQRAGIPIIEDCAQAHGAALEGRRAGTWGTLGCFSFYPTKNLGAVGDGGAVVTDDPSLALRLRRLRQYGWERKYHAVVAGGRNSRLDELQAAVLRVKLPHVDRWNERRRAIAGAYTERIGCRGLSAPTCLDSSYAAHLYVVRTPERESLRTHLAERQIGSDVHYPVPDYLQPALHEHLGQIRLPITERCCREVLTLPCFSEMTDTEVAQVIAAVSEWLGT